MADFRIQHFEVTLAASAGFAFVTIPTAIDVTRSRVMNVNITSQFPIVGGEPTGSFSALDQAVSINIGGPSLVILSAHPNRAYDTVVRFDVFSYVGAIGGPNEFVAYRFALDIGEFDTIGFSQEREFSLVNDLAMPANAYLKTTAHITGSTFRQQSADWTTPRTFEHQAGVILIDDELGNPAADQKVRIRGAGSEGARRWTVEVVHWVGSNWQIERANTGSGRSAEDWVVSGFGVTTPIAVPINDVLDWTTAWIEVSSVGNATTQFYSWNGLIGRPGATTSEVILDYPQNPPLAGEEKKFGFFVIKNPEVYVLHWGEANGNRTQRLEDGEREKLVDLPTPNLIDRNTADDIAVLCHGYTDRFENHAGSSGYRDDLHGHEDWIASFEPPGQISVKRTIPRGWHYEHYQVIQFNGTARPNKDVLSTIDLPNWDLTIRTA